MTKTFFHGSRKKIRPNLDRKRKDGGFTFFSVLWLLFGLSFVCASALSAVKLRYEALHKKAGQFYTMLDLENEKWQEEIELQGYREAEHAAD